MEVLVIMEVLELMVSKILTILCSVMEELEVVMVTEVMDKATTVQQPMAHQEVQEVQLQP